MKSLILTHSGYQDQEVIYPYYRLREEGRVELFAEKRGKVRGILGTDINADFDTPSLMPASSFVEFDLLVLPGGVKAMEKLRQDRHALDFITIWAQLGKPIASMCSGAQMLISARVPLKGVRLSAYPAMAVDVENAGAIYVEAPVVVDRGIISSPHYRHLAEWMRAAINAVHPGPAIMSGTIKEFAA